MTGDVQQIGQDLHFVRSAVLRRQKADLGPPLIFYLWAAYTIIGYTLIDFRPDYANRFFGIGGIVGGILSWIIGKRYSMRTGQRDKALAVRAMLHMFGGIMLSVAFIVAMAEQAESFRPFTGQVMVGMIGLIYFLWGVHFHRYFSLLGVIVIAGAVAVGRVPHFGWTALGIAIALGLILPTLVSRPVEKSGSEAADAAQG
jgi:hypothetical protein